MLDTHENSDVYKTVSAEMKEGGSAVQRQQYIKVRDHTVHVDKSYFGLCCQAAHISGFCSSCWLPGFGNQIRPRPPLEGDLSSVAFVPNQREIVVFGANTPSQKGNTPLFLNVSHRSKCGSILSFAERFSKPVEF